HNPASGAQRLSLDALRRWESLGYGMFIHFGMSTFVGKELPSGQDPSSTYAPDKLDVDQWVQVARDAGMKYAILTAKHVAGHCLWPSKFKEYDVETSGNKTDVDIPGVLGPEGRKQQYDQIARLAPDAVIMLNSGFGNGAKVKEDYAWPSDIMAIERDLPTSARGYNPWHAVAGKDYYIPGEVCDP